MNNTLRVALVTESLWGMGGANRVLGTFANIYPQADIYALFGNPKKLSSDLQKHNIVFSYLNKRPFIKTLYRYTYHLWPLAIEKFSFDNYDLVISSSASVAFGIVTPVKCKHIAYIHSPLRYLWDLKTLGSATFGGLKGTIRDFLLVFIRLWEVSASSRPDVLIANSEFVSKRLKKYWRTKPNNILTPPIHYYEGSIREEKEKYIVAGAPFAPNKKGDFLLKCIASTDIKLKIIGWGENGKLFQKKYHKYKNIEFLGNISDKEKFDVLSKASCFVIPGIEDYGIFPVEAMSAGTPALGYKAGGIMENLKEGVNGYYFSKWDMDDFMNNLNKVLNKRWNYKEVAKSVRKNNNSEEEFKKKFLDIVQSNSF